MKWLALLALCACGGPDPGFAGAWKGTSTFQLEGNNPTSYAGSLSVEVVGGDISVNGVCPTQPASIEAPANGVHAAWAGSLYCGTFAASNCANVQLTLHSGDIVLSGSTLAAVGSGVASGCGFTDSYTSTFLGTK